MRRIIERTMTIVITTTWTISWREDAIPSDPQADPVTNGLPYPDTSQEAMPYTRQSPFVIDAKEVE